MHFIRRLFLLLIVWGVALSTFSEARTPDVVAHVKVSLFDDAHIAPVTLAQARVRATFLMAQAGIGLEWLNCPAADPSDFTPSVSPCSVVEWPRHLSVRIVLRGNSANPEPETFGRAFLNDAGCGVYAKVYYQNLVASRDILQLTEGDMLGFVIAHELGHLLLGSNSHSTTGVMQAHWTATTLHEAAHNTLFFTSAQAATLRSRLSRASMDLAHASSSPLTLADGRSSASSRPLAGITTVTTSPPSSVFARLLPR
jgi:hypothetical protein